jgi:protein tyrosine phosphatase
VDIKKTCLFNINSLVLFSSGTGRTGTYIAVDIIIHLLNQSINNLSTMKLDIMGIVNQLKHDRINMVQTSVRFTPVKDVRFLFGM